MDLTKHFEFFNPVNVIENVHVIGCGAIGSNVAEQLVRLGLQYVHLYDFDTVDAHNITNQNYFADQIGKPKCLALQETLLRINPACNITIHPKGWNANMALNGYIFICVDSIATRQQIAQSCRFKNNWKAIFDFRMRLSDAQHYAAKQTTDEYTLLNLLKTMDFTDEEAKTATPISACGTTLSVLPTIRTIVSLGIANFINFVKNKSELKTIILIDAFKPDVIAMSNDTKL